MNSKDKDEDRPVSYPKPTEADKQLQNQPEYIDQEPNHYEKEVSDTGTSGPAVARGE